MNYHIVDRFGKSLGYTLRMPFLEEGEFCHETGKCPGCECTKQDEGTPEQSKS